MDKSRIKLWILLCGIAISTATPQCHAQDTETQSEVKKPQTVVAPVFLPKNVDTPSPLPAEVKPDKKTSETPWYWRFLGWFAMDVAKYYTEKQNDGRPQSLGNFR